MFGCKCFYLIKGVCFSKLESKALEGIFVGYGLESHTYRIYDKLSGAVIESCSVTFEEYDGPQSGVLMLVMLLMNASGCNWNNGCGIYPPR